MKDFITKIINSVLAVTFAFGLVVTMYHMTRFETNILSASILDGHVPGDIVEIQFVSPKGAAYPVNGVVTIQSVFVDAGGTDQGVVGGADLENSFITFMNGSIPCPGAVFSGNKIILPDSFNSSCTVDITVDGGATAENAGELTIEPISCAALRTSILRGYGEGFEDISSADLGAFAITDDSGSFTGFDFGSITTSVDLDYPVTTVDGARTFQIHVELAPDISTDPINGIDQRAKIVSNNGNGIYEIKIRNEGTGNEVQTALNFSYVFNDLLGADSPFVAFPDNADPEVIRLQATEMGAHPNTGYLCKADGVQISGCFSGGADGQNEGLGVLTTPLKLDNEVLQGESAIVFASNSAGEIEWISSHPSILEITTLSEAAQQDESTANFVDDVLTPAEALDKANGAYDIDCEKEYSGDPPTFVSETCQTSVAIPVSYDITGIDYTVDVNVGDEIIQVIVNGSKLQGLFEGSATYTSSGGAGYALSGTATGLVSGSISGTYSGTVTGQIQVTLQGSAIMDGQGASELQVTDFLTADFVPSAVTEGALTDVPGSFTSTVKKQENDVSHVAILYGKRPGTSILSAMDKEGCIASFDVQVVEKQVILQMVGRSPGDVLDVSDTVQINAYVGGANSELEEYENITAASGIEYFSSNEQVATIDGTGLLTALKPGVTNITARYDTGEAEIGTIESQPLQVTVNKISGLRLTFDKGTEDILPATTVEDAYKSVVIAVHDPQAAGQSLYIEGQQVLIELPDDTYNSDISKIDAIVNDPTYGLATKIADLNNSVPEPIVQVTTVDGYPGMLILQPLNQDYDSNDDSIEDIDENGIIDISSTAFEEHLSVLPTYTSAIPLPASETYGLMVIAQYDNGATKVLSPTEFTWVNTPVNYLEQGSLDSGLIRLGEHTGTSTVVANYENADGSVVRSNYLTITVDSGPVIEYVRRIGTSPVSKGARITLQTKISDINTIADITSISTSLVYSSFNTYQQINADAGAVWFTAVPFLNEVQIVDQGATEEEVTEGEAEPVVTMLNYKTYNIPIEIPADANLFDGIYKLILSVTDASNNTLNYVYPIRIGEIAGGDVNEDGQVNMIDVILAFQIAAGINKSPTPAQLVAANADGVGGVTLVDVILLFNKVTNKE